MHHADAGRERVAGRTEMHLTPVDRHATLVLRMNAGDDLHQGGLAGAVLADQPVDLPLTQREVDVAQGRNAAKGLGDALHRQPRRVGARYDRCLTGHDDQIRK